MFGLDSCLWGREEAESANEEEAAEEAKVALELLNNLRAVAYSLLASMAFCLSLAKSSWVGIGAVGACPDPTDGRISPEESLKFEKYIYFIIHIS